MSPSWFSSGPTTRRASRGLQGRRSSTGASINPRSASAKLGCVTGSTTSRRSLARSLGAFASAFLAFALLGAVAATWIGEIPTMSLLSIVAILVLLIGGTTQLLPGPVLIGVATAWPCAMLLSLVDLGDLGPSLRPTVVATTPSEAARAAGRVLEIPEHSVRIDLLATSSRTTPYFDSVTRSRKQMTGRFKVAPLTDGAWTAGDGVGLWVGCSNLSDVFDACRDVWAESGLRFLHADPYLRDEFDETIRLAADRHGLESAPTAVILRALDAEELAGLRRLPRITVAVLAVGFLVGALWTLRSTSAAAKS